MFSRPRPTALFALLALLPIIFIPSAEAVSARHSNASKRPSGTTHSTALHKPQPRAVASKKTTSVAKTTNSAKKQKIQTTSAQKQTQRQTTSAQKKITSAAPGRGDIMRRTHPIPTAQETDRVTELSSQVKHLSTRVEDLTAQIKLLNEQLSKQTNDQTKPTKPQQLAVPTKVKPPVVPAKSQPPAVPEKSQPRVIPAKSQSPVVPEKVQPPVAPPAQKGPPLLPKATPLIKRAASAMGIPIPWKSVPASSGSAVPAPFAASVDGNIQSSIRELRRKSLTIPVDGITPESMKGNFYSKRGARQHNAVDMLVPRYTPIHAVEAGTIGRLFTSAAGGLTIYQLDPSHKFVYYYAHLDHYADNLHDGDTVKRNQVIGYVGTTGNAPANCPHLHFAISTVGEHGSVFHGTPIDPYEVYR